MAIQLRSSQAPVKKYLKLALYGAPGTGKTYLALQFPNVVIVDTEGGTDFYGDRPGFVPFRVLQTKRLDDVIELIDAIERREIMCETLVIDSVTVLYEVLRESAARAAEQRALRKGQPVDEATITLRDWGKIKLRFQSLMTRLYNLPVNTIFTGWLKEIFEGEGDSRKVVGTTLDADKKALYQPDLVLHLDVVKGKHVAYVKKDRTGTWAVDTRLTDLSYKTFAPLLERMGKGQVTAVLQTEEEAVEAGAKAFDQEQALLDRLSQVFAAKGIDSADAVTLAGLAVKRKIGSLDELQPQEVHALITRFEQADANALQAFLAKLHQANGASAVPSEAVAQ